MGHWAPVSGSVAPGIQDSKIVKTLMKRSKRMFCTPAGALLLLLTIAPMVAAQDQALSPAPSAGPVIEGLGPVYPMSGDFLNLSTRGTHKAVMDVAKNGGFDLALNPSFESAARYLNMHVRHGIALKNLRLSLVIHGQATKDTLSDAAYRERYGVNNPNTALLGQLQDAGVEFFVCGQSLLHNGFSVAELNGAVRPALSAMTAHVVLSEEGFHLIPF
jgi:intracellular sulfur oxidation DsrE/DsrF family protein